MMGYDGVLFCGADGTGSDHFFFRGLGPYRLRTVMAQKGYRIKVIDFCEHYSVNQLIELVRRYVGPSTKFLAVSTTYMSADLVAKILHPEIVRIARSLTSAKLQIISGGARALLYPHRAVDWYVSGYADEAFPALADFISGKSLQIKFTDIGSRKHVDSNHSYPVKDTSDLTTIWLAEDLIRSHEALPIEIARGCIFRCSFCAYPLNGKKKFDYIRDPENLLSEIRRNREVFGVTQYGFMDDTYNDSEFKMGLMHKALSSLEFKIRFSAYIKPELLNTWPHHTELLAESGLMGAAMGFESFHHKARQAVRKGADIEGMIRTIEKLHHDSQNGVGIEGSFIAGLPHETMESLLETHEWLKRNTHIIQLPMWKRLYILKESPGVYASDIDKNPAAYGYRVSYSDQWINVRWRTETLTSELCDFLQNYFWKDMKPHRKWGGWSLLNYSRFGLFDLPELVKSRSGLEASLDPKAMLEARWKFTRDYYNLQLSGHLNQPDFVPHFGAKAAAQ